MQAIKFSISPNNYARRCIVGISDYGYYLVDRMRDRIIDSTMEAIWHIAHGSRPSVGVGDT